MSFKKSMKSSNRSTSAKMSRQRVPNSRCRKNKGTFTLFRLDKRNLKLVLREKPEGARRSFSDEEFSKVKKVH